jgi:acetyl-CoA carboxylase biotin carboxyl carrier protein
MSGIDAEVIRHALKTAREFNFRSVRLKTEEGSFRAVLDPDMADDSPELDLTSVIVDRGPEEWSVVAPAVGYLSLVKSGLTTGKSVAKGDVVGTVVALGLPNDVNSPGSGEIVEVRVNEGDPVEYGQVIAVIRAKDGGS